MSDSVDISNLPKFSVVLNVYKNNRWESINAALMSLLDQLVRPSEILVISDGPSDVTFAWDSIFSFAGEMNVLIRLIELPVNLGLADSRNIGVDACSTEYIFNMDADDLCRPTRFQSSLPVLVDGADFVSSYIVEVDRFSGGFLKVRECVVGLVDRFPSNFVVSPINHVTLGYRRTTFESIGGYSSRRFLEDLELVGRMLLYRVNLIGIADVLVEVNVDDIEARRSGYIYFAEEVALLWRFYRSGLITFSQAMLGCSVRALIRFSRIGLKISRYFSRKKCIEY